MACPVPYLLAGAWLVREVPQLARSKRGRIILGAATGGIASAAYAVRCWLLSRSRRLENGRAGSPAESLAKSKVKNGDEHALPPGLDRKRYGLSEYGFVPHPKEVCPRLPKAYQVWELTADFLAELTRSGEIRELVNSWPVLDVSPLLDGMCSEKDFDFSREVRRAYVLLSMVANCYVWCDANGPCDVMPAALAVPLHATARFLGLPPVITHAAADLWNFVLVEEPNSDDEAAVAASTAAKLRQEDLRCVTTMTGTPDEEWFYLTSTVVQRLAGPQVLASYDLFAEAVPAKDFGAIGNYLVSLTACIHEMSHALSRLPEKCSSEVFWCQMRPLLQGFGGSTNLSQGIVLDGVEEYQGRHLHLAGASAAQASAIPVFDAVLGVAHGATEADFAETMRAYMPAKHLDYLELLQRQVSLRQRLRDWRASGVKDVESLIKKFNLCLDALARFRRGHWRLVGSHIFAPKAAEEATTNGGAGCCAGEMRGTGGSPLEVFLKGTIDATLAAKL